MLFRKYLRRSFIVPKRITRKKRRKKMLVGILVLLFLSIFMTFSYLSDVPASSAEVHHVVFLKVHKAASSTIQNIFFRFGMERNLTFVVPSAKNLPYPNVISVYEGVNQNNILPLPPNSHYDICCCHVIYNRSAFQTIMPKDTVYIGSVRNPLAQFISSLNYFRPRLLYNGSYENNTRISKFLRQSHLPEFVHITAEGSLFKNRMAFEYNFPSHLMKNYNRKDALEYLKRLDLEFLLVIVVELMDESLVLLKRKLHWKTKDILYISTNIAKEQNLREITLLPGDSWFHRNMSPLDYDLYHFFYQKLFKQIHEESDDFLLEVSAFKSIVYDVQLYCMSGNLTQNHVVEESPWNKKFILDVDDCNRIKSLEISNILEIRKRQHGI